VFDKSGDKKPSKSDTDYIIKHIAILLQTNIPSLKELELAKSLQTGSTKITPENSDSLTAGYKPKKEPDPNRIVIERIKHLRDNTHQQQVSKKVMRR
jgi:hypothetical protein